MAMNTFLSVTGLSLYGKTAIVIGCGPVGLGAARHLGAVVESCDLRTDAHLAAAHLGFAATPHLKEALPQPDVLFTATGRDRSVPLEAFARCKGGAFLVNLDHTSGELPVTKLRNLVVATPRPHVERCEVEGRTPYLLTGGAMFNLATGPGDLYDTFDLVTALMLEPQPSSTRRASITHRAYTCSPGKSRTAP